jgi:mucolipin 3
MLGTGTLLVWIGLLRYLGFFKTYNVLILTMKGAAPNIFRFLICAAMVYIGFVFAGWAVLGPYNFKFASLMSTSECLFSLINGDDMYATFNYLHFHQSPSVWIYSRVYLYSFICLFIYLVLSLFISIIMDTYEIIKIGYKYGFPPSRY